MQGESTKNKGKRDLLNEEEWYVNANDDDGVYKEA